MILLNSNKKSAYFSRFLAGATGFGPAISALTGPHVKPLHHAPERHIYIIITSSRQGT